MKRLLVKWETARRSRAVPRKSIIQDKKLTIGVLFFGSSTYAAHEALDRLEENGLIINSMRVRAFPFQKEVFDFIDQHENVFVIEQNRDAQMKILLAGECQVSPGKLVPVTNFDGLPITADDYQPDPYGTAARHKDKPAQPDLAVQRETMHEFVKDPISAIRTPRKTAGLFPQGLRRSHLHPLCRLRP